MIYDYKCLECGPMEIEQPITDSKLVECPECGSKDFEKLISHSNFILKGKGWYKDGYQK